MDNETKLALGIILSEIYELKNQIANLQNEDAPHDNFRINALRAGYEHIINEELRIENGLPLAQDKYFAILKCVDDFELQNPQLIEQLTGFYDFPLEIQNKFSRIEWLYAFRAMKAEHRFDKIISKIEGSQNSPAEFYDFNLI